MKYWNSNAFASRNEMLKIKIKNYFKKHIYQERNQMIVCTFNRFRGRTLSPAPTTHDKRVCVLVNQHLPHKILHIKALKNMCDKPSPVTYYQPLTQTAFPERSIKSILRGTATSFASAFSILILIPSGPVALFGFKSSMRDTTSCALHVILDGLSWHLYSKAGEPRFRH